MVEWVECYGAKCGRIEECGESIGGVKGSCQGELAVMDWVECHGVKHFGPEWTHGLGGLGGFDRFSVCHGIHFRDGSGMEVRLKVG